MLDSLAGQMDPTIQHKHSSQHARLTNLTYVVQDKASLLGQKLERLAKQWSDIADKQRHLQTFLDMAEEDMPKPVSSGDSISTIQDKMSTYQRLQHEMQDNKPTLHQVVDKGKQLLHSVTCAPLESSIADLGEKWVALNTNVSSELKK